MPSLLVDGLFDASVLMAVPAVSADSCCACGGTSFELSDGLIASSANGKVPTGDVMITQFDINIHMITTNESTREKEGLREDGWTE